jgi:4-amino-4-deoxy-L-arabinose transferase-like glycosyltransferase
MKRTWWIYALPVGILLAVTLPHLAQGDFRAETAHYGAIGHQSWQPLAPFWALYEYPSVPYFNKPPLVFWIHGGFLHLFGISLPAARLPSILAAAGCLLFTVGLARRELGRATALATGVILALSYEYFRRTREISLDLWQLFFMMGALWFWMSATSRRHGPVWLAGLFLGLALLCKPLMALMLPLILLFWSFLGVPRRTTRWRDFTILLGMALLTCLPWHLSMTTRFDGEFLAQYFGREVAARLHGLRNREPVWYYAVEIGRSYWPWMLLLMTGIGCWARRTVSIRHSRILGAALVWVAAWAVALSLFPDKRPRYALPLYPMMALIAGYGAAMLPWKGLRQWYRRGLPVTAALILAAALTAAMLPLRVQAPPDPCLAALTDWARRQDPAHVYSAAMTSSDESMIYLKAGYWPIPLRLHPHPAPGSLLLCREGITPAPLPAGLCIFQQGPYRVIKR